MKILRRSAPTSGLGKPLPTKVVPICGLEFIGANCNAFEYGNDVVIVDAGVGFPNSDLLGVDAIIPNPKYLKSKSKNIRGLVITHGHQDHIGGIPYLIEEMGFPTIYASPFAKALILNKFKYDKPDLLPKLNIKVVNTESKLKLGKIEVEFFGVNHSIPESMGLYIKTPSAKIVHTGDFKFDNTPTHEDPVDYGRIAQIGAEGITLMLSDSTNSYREGHSLSEYDITIQLEKVIADAKGRVIVATFGSMVNRIIELLKIAKKHKKRVFVSGTSMKTAIMIAQKIGYVELPKEIFVNKEQVKRIPKKNVMVLATGSQGENLASLARMARGEHKEVKVNNGDTVILSASVIPGNGALVQNLIDELYGLGANVIHSEIMNLHTTGHGHKEEQKLMINLVKPKFFMPVHGFQSFLAEHAKTATRVGISPENQILAKNGEVIAVTDKGWKKVGRVPANPVNVSGAIVGDVGNAILEERQKLASYGVFIYTLVVDKASKELKFEPVIKTSGFIYIRSSKDLLVGSIEIIKQKFEESKGKSASEIEAIINKELNKFFLGKTERDPMIHAVITYV